MTGTYDKPGLRFSGTDLLICAGDLPPELLANLQDCGRPGPADSAVARVRASYQIEGDESDCRAYLKGYGAWDDEELADHEANLDRLVWLTGCALAEGEEAYFSAY